MIYNIAYIDIWQDKTFCAPKARELMTTLLPATSKTLFDLLSYKKAALSPRAIRFMNTSTIERKRKPYNSLQREDSHSIWTNQNTTSGNFPAPAVLTAPCICCPGYTRPGWGVGDWTLLIAGEKFTPTTGEQYCQNSRGRYTTLVRPSSCIDTDCWCIWFKGENRLLQSSSNVWTSRSRQETSWISHD